MSRYGCTHVLFKRQGSARTRHVIYWIGQCYHCFDARSEAVQKSAPLVYSGCFTQSCSRATGAAHSGCPKALPRLEPLQRQKRP